MGLAGLFSVVVFARRRRRTSREGVQYTWFYIVLGCLLWLTLYDAGVNADSHGSGDGAAGTVDPAYPCRVLSTSRELADCQHRR